MFILTRKLGESIRVGDDVEIFVLRISRGKAKLGFRAPAHVAIKRSETVAHSEAAECRISAAWQPANAEALATAGPVAH